LGRRTLLENGQSPDFVKVGLMIVTLGVVWRFKKVPEPLVVLAAAVAGLVLYPLVH
jgi:chromate transporter